MIAGRTFPNQKVPAAAHGAVFRGALSDGVLSGCELSFTGKNLTIGKGLFIEGGREVEITAAVLLLAVPVAAESLYSATREAERMDDDEKAYSGLLTED